jgi:hypothetical protein
MITHFERRDHLEEPYLEAAYQEEEQKLADVIEYIDREVTRIARRSPATAAYQQTANAIQRRNDEKIRLLLSNLERPFSGDSITFRWKIVLPASQNRMPNPIPFDH